MTQLIPSRIKIKKKKWLRFIEVNSRWFDVKRGIIKYWLNKKGTRIVEVYVIKKV